MVNIGFIGVGGMGRYQVSSFLNVRAARIVAGADPSAKAGAAFAELVPTAKVYRDHRSLLRDPKVDAVVVAVPTGLHKSMAVDVLRSGRPVLVEKPMARTVAEAKRMIDAAGKARQVLMVAHCRRYDPVWGTLAAAYRRGTIGQPALWRHSMGSRGPGGWFMDDRLGGGPLVDGAVHDYDFANMMFGPPERVMSAGIKMNPAVTAVDTATAIVQYASGDQLTASWSWAIPGDGMQDMLGPRGSLRPGTGNLEPPKNAGKGTGYFCFTGVNGKQKLLPYRGNSGEMYVNQARHFLACIAGRAECRTPGAEAIKAVAVADAIVRTARRGGVCKVTW